tara:strand:- start:27108 stop:28625 length:1518 start_codon:yes stop_codon:yes gene_type:complete
MNKSDSYILALDQGTTSSRAILFNDKAQVIGQAQHEFEQIFPKSGWVEHDPMEIWSSQRSALTDVLERNSVSPEKVHAIGITNQRETTIIWDKKTGQPVYNAIVWQCRRTMSLCQKLVDEGKRQLIQDKTGLVLDPYFSASKIKWILDHVDGARKKAEAGELLFGTVDSWITWKLTRGNIHITDPTNASRTMLYNIHTKMWDDELLDLFNVPRSMLPEVRPSSSYIGLAQVGGKEIPICGIAGDQQASLFGQQCFKPGSAKNTYGTGCFLLMNTGTTPVQSSHGLLTTLALGSQCELNYALEGSVFMGGATIQWLRDELGFVRDEHDSAYFAQKVDSNEGVYLVPAFTGLGAPYWDPQAKGALSGLTRGTNRNHIIRAALEAIAYQSLDVLKAMQKDAQLNLQQLHVDGGAIKNNFLMQFQADMIDVDVILSHQAESSAFGAACLAGLASDFWHTMEEIHNKIGAKKTFKPQIDQGLKQQYYQGWQKAVQATLTSVTHHQPYPIL